ncbi:MAG: alpha/beta hydrolase [Marinagarivorans sp.]
MAFTAAQAQRLKSQLGEFNGSADLGSSAEALAYVNFYGLDQLGAQQYAAGFYQPKGVLRKWGRLMTHYWRCPEQAGRHGTICLAPGLFDHAGLFAPLIKFCLAEGYDLVCIEMPGHGLSDGQYCAIDSFFTYAAIWEAFILQHALLLSAPLVGLGQSTGCTGLTALGLNPAGPLSASIFFSPLVRPQHWLKVQTTYFALGNFLQKVTRGLRTNSHHEPFNQLLFNDPLQPQFLSVQWVRALMAWVEAVDDWPGPCSNLPVWIFQGTDDEVVDFEWNIACLSARFCRLNVAMIEGAKHHLANEAPHLTQTLWPAVAQVLQGLRKGAGRGGE